MTYGIVISSYKYGHLASHAIESVISQSRQFDKIWFVDDGVGDCKHLPNIYPEVNYVFRETNLGTVNNFQDMLQRVDTDYVMFMGADNWLRDDTLELLTQKDTDIVMYDIFVTGEKKKEIKSRHGDQIIPYEGGWWWSRKGGHHGSMLYKTEKAKQVGGYNDGFGRRTLEDLSLFNRLLESGATISHIDEALLYYRRHRENFNPC